MEANCAMCMHGHQRFHKYIKIQMKISESTARTVEKANTEKLRSISVVVHPWRVGWNNCQLGDVRLPSSAMSEEQTKCHLCDTHRRRVHKRRASKSFSSARCWRYYETFISNCLLSCTSCGVKSSGFRWAHKRRWQEKSCVLTQRASLMWKECAAYCE